LPDPLQVKEYTLSNGLSVWLNVDHSQPKVFGAVVVKAGAKDTPNTGIAHYFEHIMFKGTDKIGTVDYMGEKQWLDTISACYDELASTRDAKKRSAIQKKINGLSVEAAKYVIPNEFTRLITRYGGTGLNAGTSYDYTVYYNTFSPQYIAQWAELNSERLRHPVFRMFQSELETVYEEKNMHRDGLAGDAVEKFIERFFYPHPYAYPVIGSTENLKNPRLSEMRKFFETYYVASNMGLILSGDFDAQATMPLLEAAFSRIRGGEVQRTPSSEIHPFRGEEKFQVRFPIPIVAGAAYAYRGVPANHPDQVALDIVISLLNNSNGTGFFDKLMVNHKLMAAMTMSESFNEAGFLAIIAIPKLVFQSVDSAASLIRHEVERIKEGDFSEALFSSLKLEQKRKYLSRLESISARSEVMITLFSQGKSWEGYLHDLGKIDKLGKDDIVDIARKYFTEDYLYVTKKTGKYPKENLPKPDFHPVIPRNAEANSDYARWISGLPVRQVRPRFLDFKRDVRILPVSTSARLYAAANPVNDIFSLDLSFAAGKLEHPELSQLASYLPLLGTETLPFDEFRGNLQKLGSTLSFEVGKNHFLIRLSGFDTHFKVTMQLLATFLKQAKAEDKKMTQLLDEEKLLKKAFAKSADEIARALMERVKYGGRSSYLSKLSFADIKKMKGENLLAAFHELRQAACDIFYCGTLPAERVADCLKEELPLGETDAYPSRIPFYRPLAGYEKPAVYFCETPEAAQSIVFAYVKGQALPEEADRYAARLFTAYFGGDMSSILFQEIREFRSYAYRTKGRYAPMSRILRDKPGEFTAMLSTQADKTIDAMGLLDSLIRQMPLKPDRLPAAKQILVNQMSSKYPTFRKIPGRIAALVNDGCLSDPDRALFEQLPAMDMDDVARFYEAHLKGRPIIYAVTGNSHKIDMNKLAAFGPVVRVKKEELYN
jgi:predicted Zn-dependent peptidase